MTVRQPGLERADARYSRGAIGLHWLTAACFAFQIGLGWQMTGPRGPGTFGAFQLHKSVGITILLLTLARLGWRFLFRAPPYPASLRSAEKVLAQIIHAGFYLLLVGIPLSGWLIVSSSKIPVQTLLYGTIPWPHVPGASTLDPARKALVNQVAAGTHVTLVWLALAAILLHVAGALKHQLFEHGDYLGRMAPLPRRSLTGAALLIPALLIGLTALGWTLHIGARPSESAPPTVERQPVPAPSVGAPPAVVQPVAQPTAKSDQTQPAKTPPAAATEPSIWTVRTAESALHFHTAWSQGPVDGGFGSWRAAIRFDPDALARSSVTVTIDMASVTAANSDQQSALPQNDWFAVGTYPTATWQATAIRHLGGDRYRAEGRLSLRGISRPLPLDFTLKIAGDAATMHGTAKIDRTMFGVGQDEWASTADLPALVTLTIDIKADRAKDPAAK